MRTELITRLKTEMKMKKHVSILLFLHKQRLFHFPLKHLCQFCQVLESLQSANRCPGWSNGDEEYCMSYPEEVHRPCTKIVSHNIAFLCSFWSKNEKLWFKVKIKIQTSYIISLAKLQYHLMSNNTTIPAKYWQFCRQVLLTSAT